MRNGVTLTVSNIYTREELEKAFWEIHDSTGDVSSPNKNYKKSFPMWRIETGDKQNAIFSINVEEIVMASFLDYVDEQAAARGNGIVRPSGPIPPQLHRR